MSRWNPEEYNRDEVADTVLGEIAAEPALGQYKMGPGNGGILIEHTCTRCGTWSRVVVPWNEVNHVLQTGQPVVDENGQPTVYRTQNQLIVKLPCGSCPHEATAPLSLREVAGMARGA